MPEDEYCGEAILPVVAVPKFAPPPQTSTVPAAPAQDDVATVPNEMPVPERVSNPTLPPAP